MKGIPVHIRRESGAESKPLVEVPWGTDLEDVILLLRDWGVTADGDDIPGTDIYGQFRVDEGRAPYFEVILPFP